MGRHRHDLKLNAARGVAVQEGMRTTIIGSLLAFLSLTSGCTLHVRPVETVVVEERAPRPVRTVKASPMLSHHQAVAQAEGYCDVRRYDCRLDHAKLVRNGQVWRVHFDARSRRSHGKVFVQVDARSGRILEAKETGRLKRRHG